jgi:hypothetical protein
MDVVQKNKKVPEWFYTPMAQWTREECFTFLLLSEPMQKRLPGYTTAKPVKEHVIARLRSLFIKNELNPNHSHLACLELINFMLDCLKNEHPELKDARPIRSGTLRDDVESLHHILERKLDRVPHLINNNHHNVNNNNNDSPPAMCILPPPLNNDTFPPPTIEEMVATAHASLAAYNVTPMLSPSHILAVQEACRRRYPDTTNKDTSPYGIIELPTDTYPLVRATSQKTPTVPIEISSVVAPAPASNVAQMQPASLQPQPTPPQQATDYSQTPPLQIASLLGDQQRILNSNESGAFTITTQPTSNSQ